MRQRAAPWLNAFAANFRQFSRYICNYITLDVFVGRPTSLQSGGLDFKEIR